MCTTAKYYVGKGRQQRMHTIADLRLISAESDAVRGVCALESSSLFKRSASSGTPVVPITLAHACPMHIIMS